MTTTTGRTAGPHVCSCGTQVLPSAEAVVYVAPAPHLAMVRHTDKLCESDAKEPRRPDKACTCTGGASWDGPEADCDVHGLPSAACQLGYTQGYEAGRAAYRQEVLDAWTRDADANHETDDQLAARFLEQLTAAPGDLAGPPPFTVPIVTVTSTLLAQLCHAVLNGPARTEQLDEARRSVLKDAADCLRRTADHWRAEPHTNPSRSRHLFAYWEAARVLTSWAQDPSRMNGPLRAIVREAERPTEQLEHDGLLLLTGAEQDVVLQLGAAFVAYAAIIGTGPSCDGDLAEACSHIHALQHAVMANAAARAYPELFRKLGGTVGLPTATELLEETQP